jgi:molybdenum cofactor guanylyltransferase
MRSDDNSFSSVILAGGRSSRMGCDKGSLPFAGMTILDGILKELRQCCDDLVLVTPPPSQSSMIALIESRADLTIVHDDMPFEGPVGALARGLSRARHPVVFACSCDLPLLNGELARRLCAMLGGTDAVIPEVDARLHPLHAAYRRDQALAALRMMEEKGERRLTALAFRLKVRRMGAAELRAFDPELRSLINVNTPEDYTRALRCTEGGGVDR